MRALFRLRQAIFTDERRHLLEQLNGVTLLPERSSHKRHKRHKTAEKTICALCAFLWLFDKSFSSTLPWPSLIVMMRFTPAPEILSTTPLGHAPESNLSWFASPDRSADVDRSATSNCRRCAPHPLRQVACHNRHARADAAAIIFAPTVLIIIELFALPPSLRNSCGGPSRSAIIKSTSPSLSISPKATPRLARFSVRQRQILRRSQ